MKRLIAAIFLVGFGGVAQAATLDTSSWTGALSPSYGFDNGSWSTGGTSASIGRKYSALISDYGTDGDFSFSGQMTQTSSNVKGDGNMGVVFGWTDASNHYRMGWSAEVGLPDGDAGSSNQFGFWLIKEIGGIDTVLVNNITLEFSVNTPYDFSIERDGDNILYSLFEGNTELQSGVITDTTYMTGKVGVYAERNASRFSDLELAPIPLPGTLPLLAGGLVLAGALGRRRRRS